MRCEEAEIRLMELIEEDLPPARRAEVLTHLEGCTACAAELSAYQELLVRLRAAQVPEPSPGFWEEFLPSLKHRIEQEALSRTPASATWLAGGRSWLGLKPRLIVGVAAAAALLIVVNLPGLLPVRPEREGLGPSLERSAGRGGEKRGGVLAPEGEGGMRRPGEPVVVAGEFVEEPSMLVAAVQRLPWADEMADRVETAWVLRPEADPAEVLASLDEKERQMVVDRMRGFR